MNLEGLSDYQIAMNKVRNCKTFIKDIPNYKW